MIFNSVTYLVFLGLATALYWTLPRRPRLWMLFLASLCFYGFWRWEFLPVMLISTVTDYFAARGISSSQRAKIRRLYLLISLAVNLGLLAYFKYLIFFAENVSGLFQILGFSWQTPTFSIVLPLGISFYTFQTISYTIDVYRGFIKPERDFILYGCYVTFFPQLVAGPVLRAREVIPQLDQRSPFLATDFAYGSKRILYGLFLKVVLADNIAPIVDSGFAQGTSTLSAIDTCTLAFLFGYQIYFDFSGYSHIAIGSAKLMGISFPENFDFPYLATSPRDFWRRWHISLSSWIRDYLYLPLAGATVHDRSTGGLAEAADEVRPLRHSRALFLTWALMGLWHGAAWTFVFWGIYHATFIFAYRRISRLATYLPEASVRVVGWAATLVIAMLSWIPFRADSLGTTFEMYSTLLSPSAYLWLGLRENYYLVAGVVLMLMILTHSIAKRLGKKPREHQLGWMAGEAVVLGVVISMVFVFLRPIKQFIYFQF